MSWGERWFGVDRLFGSNIHKGRAVINISLYAIFQKLKLYILYSSWHLLNPGLLLLWLLSPFLWTFIIEEFFLEDLIVSAIADFLKGLLAELPSEFGYSKSLNSQSSKADSNHFDHELIKNIDVFLIRPVLHQPLRGIRLHFFPLLWIDTILRRAWLTFKIAANWLSYYLMGFAFLLLRFIRHLSITAMSGPQDIDFQSHLLLQMALNLLVGYLIVVVFGDDTLYFSISLVV